jgi:phage FluMu protein Com
MTAFTLAHGGLIFAGEGDRDLFCGRCGRLLARGVDPGTVRDLWVVCPKCKWINGLDLGLAWAEHVVKLLTEREFSLERLREIAKDAHNPDISNDEFAARTTDAGPAVSWLRKISVPLLVSILTLLATVYFGIQQLDIAEQTLKASERATQRPLAPRQATYDDVVRLARELHRLQGEIRLRPPPRSTRGGKHGAGKRR